MLRFGWLPSDMNPMLLLLGEAEDLAALAGGLEAWAHRPAMVDLVTLAPGAASPANTRVMLVPTAACAGLHPAAGGFEWRLNAAGALTYAALVADLAMERRRAGSAMLGPDAPDATAGLPVKVSRGEYLDEVLDRGSIR